MPQSALRVVAVIIAMCAVGGFALGIRNVPDKARLPGESAGGGAALEATDAQPVGELLVTDPPPPIPEDKTEEEAEEKSEEVRAAEMAKLEAEAKAVAAAKAAAAQPKAVTPPPEDKVGDLIDGLTPPPEQPPY